MSFVTSKRGALLAAVAAAGLLTAGCATETTYRPATGQGFSRTGYSDRQIEANRFIITFSGNSYTSRDTVERYLLFRAAELTVHNGADYFVMVHRDTDKDTRTYSSPGFGGGYGGFGYGGYGGFGGFWGPSWRYYGRGFGARGWSPFYGDPFWDRGIDVTTVQRYEAVAEIVTGRGPKPADNVRAFDARQVMDRLGPTIVVPK